MRVGWKGSKPVDVEGICFLWWTVEGYISGCGLVEVGRAQLDGNRSAWHLIQVISGGWLG